MFWACVILLIVSVSSRKFDNPVIPNFDAPDPGVVFFQGKYYAVTTTSNNDLPDKFPIHVSTDLQNWQLITYVINDVNRPIWSTNIEYWAPEIHVLGESQFRCYYTTRESKTKRLAIGAAFATNITGPYYSLDRPLTLDTSQDILDATLINDNGDLHLIWKGATWMYLRHLHSDGLSFDSDTVLEIMRNDMPWEGGIIEGPWVIKRNDTFYMFYSGNEYCTDKYAVGVAKSNSPSGPWIKRGDPILISDDDFKGPGHCSVVKDVNNVNDVMVYHAYKTGALCHPNPRLMCVKSMAWGADGWPYMTE